MAGNEVHARFEMENGLVAYFDSIANAGNAAVPTYPPGFVTIIEKIAYMQCKISSSPFRDFATISFECKNFIHDP